MSAPSRNVSWTTVTMGPRVRFRRTSRRRWTSRPEAARSFRASTSPVTNTWEGNPFSPATSLYGTTANAVPSPWPGKCSMRPAGLTLIGVIPGRLSVSGPMPTVRAASGDSRTPEPDGMPGTDGASLR